MVKKSEDTSAPAKSRGAKEGVVVVETTTLAEIMPRLKKLDDSLTIAMRRPWSAQAGCVLVSDETRGGMSRDDFPAPYEYFLELDVVHEVLEVFDGRKVSVDDKMRAILYYAENDAWPDWVHQD